MNWLVPLASSMLFDTLAGVWLSAWLPDGMVPSLGLIWVIVQADRTPSTAAREGDMWINGILLSALLGYTHDLLVMSFQTHHLIAYVMIYILTRFFTDRLAQGNRLRIALVCGLGAMGSEFAIWWVKHVMAGFTSAYFAVVPFVFFAIANALLGAAILPRLAAMTEDANAARRF